MITTMNSKRDKHEDVKEDIKIVKCGGGEEENVDLFLGCVRAYMTTGLKQVDIVMG